MLRASSQISRSEVDVHAITKGDAVQSGVPDEDIQAFQDEAASGDYDHVLQTAFATVTVL